MRSLGSYRKLVVLVLESSPRQRPRVPGPICPRDRSRLASRFTYILQIFLIRCRVHCRTMFSLRRAPFVCRACQRSYNGAIKGPTSNRVFRHAYSTVLSRKRPFHIAIIGSGPAGYYTAYGLMKKLSNVWVTMYESLPVPYGLVRFGVAPDHPEVKVRTTEVRHLPTRN